MRQDAVIEVADRGKTRHGTQPRRNQEADTFDQGTDGSYVYLAIAKTVNGSVPWTLDGGPNWVSATWLEST